MTKSNQSSHSDCFGRHVFVVCWINCHPSLLLRSDYMPHETVSWSCSFSAALSRRFWSGHVQIRAARQTFRKRRRPPGPFPSDFLLTHLQTSHFLGGDELVWKRPPVIEWRPRGVFTTGQQDTWWWWARTIPRSLQLLSSSAAAQDSGWWILLHPTVRK